MTSKTRCFTGAMLMLSASLSAAEPITAAYLDTIQASLQHNDLTFTGTLGPLVNCINVAGGLELELIPAGISDILTGLNDGSFSMAIGLVKDEKRVEYATASRPLVVIPSVFLSRAVYDTQLLSDVIVLTAQGSGYSRSLNEAGAIIEYAKSYQDALLRFSRGDGDAVVVPKATITLYPEMVGDELFQVSYSSDDIVYYVSNVEPNRDALLAAIDSGMNHCVTQ